MNQLPIVLRKNGFTYTQVLRDKRSCIYEQMVDEKLKFYEVFVVQVKPDRNLFGHFYPGSEVFPSNENFGKTAWTYRTLQEAMEKLNELSKTEK